MIHDPELRALFGAESEEHLHSLDEGLLRLESAPDDRATLEDVFRHAHSLKGSARMLGLNDIESLAHAFEDALGMAARGKVALSGERIERLLGALDAVRALVREAVTGQSADVSVSGVLAALHTEAPAQSDEQPAVTAPEPVEMAAPSPVVREDFPIPAKNVPLAGGNFPLAEKTFAPEENSPARLAPVSAEPVAWSVETMRVEPAKLDTLLSMAGELVVSTTRAARGAGEWRALCELRDEWTRSVSDSRRILRHYAREKESGVQNADAGSAQTRLLRELERTIEAQEEKVERLNQGLARLGGAVGDLNRLSGIVTEMEAAIRGVRLLPLSTLFGLFPRTVRDLARSSGKTVHLEIEGGETHADKRILESLKDPLMHLIRNALDHGIEASAERLAAGKPATATLALRGFHTARGIVVEVEDDGRGLDADAIRASAARKGLATPEELATWPVKEVFDLIFASGFSTRAYVSELSGRGVGLDIVRAQVARLRGTVEVESKAGQGCTFRLTMPVTLATTRVLLVRAGGQTLGVPIEAVRGLFRLAQGDVYRFGGRPTTDWNERPISLAPLSELLGLPSGDEAPTARPCLVVEAGDERVGLLIDALLEEQEIILKPLGILGNRVPSLAGATILDTGEVCLVLHPTELLRLATRANVPAPSLPPPPPKAKSVLLVEDSITVRTQEKRIIEGAGFGVVTAVDGLDGWNKLSAGAFDAVVTDIEMPRMDGLALSARIRSNPQFADLPIILVTSLGSDDDRRRGAEVGADAYIVKSAFDQRALLDALRRLA